MDIVANAATHLFEWEEKQLKKLTFQLVFGFVVNVRNVMWS